MSDEIIETIPFQPPSSALFELLEFAEACRRDLDRACGVPREVNPSLLGWGERDE